MLEFSLILVAFDLEESASQLTYHGYSTQPDHLTDQSSLFQDLRA